MPYRILIADDEELERRALRLILGGEGMPELEILEAANGREALDLVGSDRLDAAFLDIRMPGVDGIETARRLRAARPRLPIVFLTAHDSFDYARSALRLRVEDFLLKPASAEEVAAALRRALADAVIEADGAGTREAEAKLEGAVAFIAADLRADLGAGILAEDRVERYLGLVGGRGAARAVVALRCESRGARGPAALRAVAALAERLLATGRGSALAGAGPEFALCAVLGEGAEAEGEFRSRLMGLIASAREELGASLAAGAAVSAAGADPASAAELAQAALRAAALAGGARPLVLIALSSSGGRGAEGEGAGVGRRTATRALELLDARHAEELSLESVAQELGVSPSHLSRLLARYAGMGFADCLARLRVKRAKAYLLSSGLSIKEAATLVGFRDPAYFSRVFRRFEGESPAEFRSSGANGG